MVLYNQNSSFIFQRETFPKGDSREKGNQRSARGSAVGIQRFGSWLPAPSQRRQLRRLRKRTICSVCSADVLSADLFGTTALLSVPTGLPDVPAALRLPRSAVSIVLLSVAATVLLRAELDLQPGALRGSPQYHFSWRSMGTFKHLQPALLPRLSEYCFSWWTVGAFKQLQPAMLRNTLHSLSVKT